MHNSIYHDRLAEHFCTLSISGAPSFANPPQKGDVFSIIKKTCVSDCFTPNPPGCARVWSIVICLIREVQPSFWSLNIFRKGFSSSLFQILTSQRMWWRECDPRRWRVFLIRVGTTPQDSSDHQDDSNHEKVGNPNVNLHVWLLVGGG